jgi:hypothetical protein
MYKFDDYTLGRTDETVQLENRDENRIAALRMVQQSRHSIAIISRTLAPEVYDNVEFVEAMKNLILQNRHSNVRLLVFDTQSIIRHGHRLISLIMNLSSYIECRTPGPEFSHFNEDLFIADSIGYIHRLNADRFESTLNFNDPRVSRHLLQDFQHMWDRAVPDSNFRKLHI